MGLPHHVLEGVSQAYYILDEVLISGELQESSKKAVARVIAAQVKGNGHRDFSHIYLTVGSVGAGYFGGNCKRASGLNQHHHSASHQVGVLENTHLLRRKRDIWEEIIRTEDSIYEGLKTKYLIC